MIAIFALLPLFSLSLAFPLPSSNSHRHFRRAEFTLANGQEAQKLNRDFAELSASDACNTGDLACIDGKFAQCGNGKWLLTQCPSGLSCQVLPLVNKAGTSITCDTQEDAERRIAATGATGGLFGDDNLPDCEDDGGDIGNPRTLIGTSTPSAGQPTKIATPPTNTSKAAAVTTTSKAAAGTSTSKAGTATTTTKASGGNATKTTSSAAATSTGKGNNNGGSGGGKGGNGNGNSAIANFFRKLLAQMRTSNVRKAQRLNKSFAAINSNEKCRSGSVACLDGGFAQCINKQWVTSACPASTKCEALPLEFRPGTYLSCETDKDAIAKISFAAGKTTSLTG
ncbi:hypothetical protein BT69DRAFT_1338150 [Atractiella rhizophila]|nr:hypothetical protein BT69DRAFT_1338150 [Atractiella rhizophila]